MMEDEIITYKQAFKAQILLIVIMCALYAASVYLIYPLDTNLKLGGFLFFTAGIGYFIVLVLRRAQKKVLCPGCESNLYLLIDMSEASLNIKVNYCPSCGTKINT